MNKTYRIYKLFFNEHLGKYVLVDQHGYPYYNHDSADECLKRGCDFLGIDPSEVKII